MRKTTLVVTGLILGAATFIAAEPAEAIVCARGAHHAGCVGPRGATVVTHRAPVTTCRFINRVRVCKRHW
ncbi:MAG: hypothetical protein WB816_04050 [Methylocystis sp.]